jgi:hypothetical protein
MKLLKPCLSQCFENLSMTEHFFQIVLILENAALFYYGSCTLGLPFYQLLFVCPACPLSLVPSFLPSLS